MRQAFAVLFCVVLSACADGAHSPRSDEGASLSLLSALGMAEGLMRQADALEATGDVPGAIARAQEILTVPFPDTSDREDVRLDAYGRLAELELARGDAESARRQADTGIAEATRDSYFHARLLLVLGRAQEAEAAAQRALGDEEAARAGSLAAIDTLEASIRMNERVLLRLGAGGEPRQPEETAP